jgi:hypothetical protein
METDQRREAAECFVRDMLRLFGQHADAENPVLVSRVARKVMRALPKVKPVERSTDDQ